jgi:hypothetical protein
LGDNALFGLHTDPAIRVPAESVNAYKSASGWNAHATRITALEDGA